MSGSRPHRQLGRWKWTGGARPSTGLAHPKPTACHSNDLTGRPEADHCSSTWRASRASVQRRLVWQHQVWSAMDEAPGAKMVLCGSPGDTGVRVNALRQPPSPM